MQACFRKLVLSETKSLIKIKSIGQQPCISNLLTYRFRAAGQTRYFHHSLRREKVIPYLLADIGEGITECQIIEWFVEPGTNVKQFDKICEVQSDKASVEITSRFDGVIKALHYQQDELAVVGRPLVDIDIEDEGSRETSEPPTSTNADSANNSTIEVKDGPSDFEPGKDWPKLTNSPSRSIDVESPVSLPSSPEQQSAVGSANSQTKSRQSKSSPTTTATMATHKGSVATPAIRHMLKKLNLDIEDIEGTGKDGRVLKEDVQRYQISATASQVYEHDNTSNLPEHSDQVVRLSPTESQMFRVMAQSTRIPQFLYTHTVDVTSLNASRQILNSHTSSNLFDDESIKITLLCFILKAISSTLTRFPRVNSHLNDQLPELTLKSAHNFGIAMDTPKGLLVPVLQNVQSHSIVSLARSLKQLKQKGETGSFIPNDFKGATFSVSNIGTIGGDVVSPVVVSPMVAIVGIGKVRQVAVLETDACGSTKMVNREKLTLSWSGDHRVLDGATLARCAETAGALLENFDRLAVSLK